MSDLRAQLIEKLNPGAMRVSPKFAAMLAFFLDEQWTDPFIVDMAITSDDILLAGTNEDPLLDSIEGSGTDLWRNLDGVGKAAGLTEDEQAELISRARARITDWQRAPRIS